MKLASKPKFYAGIVILALLGVSYFIKLGVIIFHSPFILLIYLAVTASLIISGIRKIKFI